MNCVRIELRYCTAPCRLSCGPTEQRAHPPHEIAGRERFGDVDVGAHGHAFGDFGVAPFGGEHDDLDIPPVLALADRPAHFVAALLRHHHVEHDKIGPGGFDALE